MHRNLPPRRMIFVMTALLVMASWFVPTATIAYSPAGATPWADNHANPGTENCALSVCLPNDGAAFVSQVLWWGGGYVQTAPKTTNTHDHHFWWEKTVGGGFAYTDSWGGAQALYDFQILHGPGGVLIAIKPGTSTSSASGIHEGSLFFYDWTGNGTIDHVAYHAGSGKLDPTSGWVGDVVDQHSTGTTGGPHYRHGFWSDEPYNPNAAITKIYLVQISSLN